VHETKKFFFFFFLFFFFLRKEKLDNKTPPYEVRFRVCEGSGISFFTFHPRDRQIIPAPQGGFPFFFFAHLPRKRLPNSSFHTLAVQTKAARRFFM
jgi:hypothetical protein